MNVDDILLWVFDDLLSILWDNSRFYSITIEGKSRPFRFFFRSLSSQKVVSYLAFWSLLRESSSVTPIVTFSDNFGTRQGHRFIYSKKICRFKKCRSSYWFLVSDWFSGKLQSAQHELQRCGNNSNKSQGSAKPQSAIFHRCSIYHSISTSSFFGLYI